jgi:hypothetical protein
MELLCFLFAIGATFILGTAALINGKIKLSRRRTVTGPSARLIGIILICAIPLAVFLAVLGLIFQLDSAFMLAIAVWPASVLMAVVIGIMTAKANSELIRTEVQIAPSKTAVPKKQHAERELCSLCGKPLEPNEFATRVCRLCR